MPQFKLVTTDGPNEIFEFNGSDARVALKMYSKVELSEADLFQEEAYLCTVRRSPVHPNIWMLYQKKGNSPPELCGCVRV